MCTCPYSLSSLDIYKSKCKSLVNCEIILATLLRGRTCLKRSLGLLPESFFLLFSIFQFWVQSLVVFRCPGSVADPGYCMYSTLYTVVYDNHQIFFYRIRRKLFSIPRIIQQVLWKCNCKGQTIFLCLQDQILCEPRNQSKELTRGPPELDQHFRLQGEFTSAQRRCMS